MRQRAPRRPSALEILLLAAASLAAPALPARPGETAGPPAVAAGPAAASRRWSLAPQPVAAEGGLLALAVGPGGTAAAGDARGLLLRAGGGWRRIALRGAVRDLAYAPDGALWVASEEGLFRLSGDRLAAHPPAPGESARAVLRVVSGPGLVAVATREGVHWSRDGRTFARVEGGFGALASPGDEAGGPTTDAGERGGDGLPRDDGGSPGDAAPTPVRGLALGPPPDGASVATLWIAAERGLFRARLASRDGAARVQADRVETPAELRPAVDVAVAGDAVLALGPGVLLEADAGGTRWRAHRPELPPGALPSRLLASAAGLWIATDRGLLEADRPGGAWRRAGEPAGVQPAFALAQEGERLLVAGARGLLVGGPPDGDAPGRSAAGREPAAAGAAARAPAPPSGDRCDPPIAEVQRAALAHLDLTGARTARMWRGVRRRGALPVVTLDGTIGDDRRDYQAWDESFVSGETRRLFDRDHDRLRDRQVALRLIWSLGDLLYDDEEIDVSTEMRRTIELRDDVLDELTQLYFDRRRAREAAGLAGPDTPDGAREALRAEELAAGLDGWTGGWFGPRAGRSPCPDGNG